MLTPFLYCIYLCHMFVITLLFPNALMLGFEYFEETEDLQFNEFNLYLLFIVVAYRWRNDGKKIRNIEL
jgi:hypothetical protein